MNFTFEILLGMKRLMERASIYPRRAASLADAQCGSGLFEIHLNHIQNEAAIQTPPASLMKNGFGPNRDP